MADNTVINAGTGGDTIRDKDRAGVKTPVVALDLNPAGAETLMAGTMPVSLASVPTVTEKQDQTANVATTWTSATALNTTTATYAATGYGTANVAVRVPTTTTAGAVTIEVSQDGTDWVPAGAVRQDNSSPENPVALAYFPGTNGTRIYAFSIDAFTLIRVRLSTVIVGAGNVVVTISAVAGGIEPVVAQRSRKVPTYRAVFRATASPYLLSSAFAANGRKQFATIHHAAASTRLVRLRRVAFALQNNTVAGLIHLELRRITAAPATGNPAITPAPMSSAAAAAEATCLALPTTAGTEGGLSSHAAIQAPATVPNDARGLPWIDLLNTSSGVTFDDEASPPDIRAGVLEGYAITLEHSAASTVSGFCLMEFTEEAP